MSPEEIDKRFEELSPEVIRELGRRYFSLLTRLSTADMEFDKAYQNEGIVEARFRVFHALSELHHAIYETVSSPEKGILDLDPPPVFTLQTIRNALLATMQDHRHWLTTLPAEEPTTPSNDNLRTSIEALAAAILDGYGERPNTRKLAKDVARTLSKSGFRTNRRRAPQARTVEDWLVDFRRLEKDPGKDTRKLKTFNAQRALIKNKNCQEAIRLLERISSNLSPLMKGAMPLRG